MVQKKTSFDSVFHYTSERALFGIVQKDGLHFRASRYDCMNDSEEYKWLYEPAHPINQGENSLILYKICTFAP